MALKGTLGDFSLTDILQLIGLQRKTGALILRHREEEISVMFDSGRIVAADSNRRPVEDRVGSLLMRTGKLTEARLDEALKIQKKTLQRLGHVLSHQGWVENEAIRRQLTLQITETLYELFRWKDGEYDFQPRASVEWDQEFITPINCEHLIMEGAQMVDEWPMIEQVISSRTAVLRPTGAAAGVLASAASDTSDVQGSVYEDDIDFGFIADPLASESDDGAPKLTQREVHVLRWVDGSRTAIEIADLTELGAFEGFKTLSRLVEARLIEVVVADDAEGRSTFSRIFLSAAPARVLAAFLGLLVILGTLSAVQELVLSVRPDSLRLPLPVPVASASWVAHASGLDDLRRSSSAVRMTRIEEALKVYAFSRARWPEGLEEVVGEGLLDLYLSGDPWGRDYRYELFSWGYRLSESDAAGPFPAQVREHRFSVLERSLAGF